MNYSSRFFLYAPFAVLLLIAAAVGIHWWFAASALEMRLDAMLAHPAMPGVTIHYKSRSIGGFPFRLDAVFEDVRVEVATGHGPVTWRAEHFALHELTYGRDEAIFEAAGRQDLSWARMDGSPRHLEFQAGSLHASAIRDSGGLARFDLDLVQFVSPSLVAAHLRFHVRRAQDRLDVAASADDVRLAPDLRGAFGDRIKLVLWQGNLSQAHAFDRLRAGEGDWPSAAEAWRKGAGSLRAENLQIEFEGLSVLGHGDVALDGSKRLIALMDFKIAGLPDWLARNANVRPGGIAAALRARAAAAGVNEAGKLGIVLATKDGIAYLGNEPVGMIEPLY